MSAFKESDVLRLLSAAARPQLGVIEGVKEQDDCGVLAVPPGHDLCASTDFVRGTGFTLHKLGHIGHADLGRYVVAANVSDLAAMGAAPLAYLSVVRYGPDISLANIEELLAGIDRACRDLGCPLIGGDSGSYHADVLSGTALGLLPTGRRLSRTTLRDGDAIYVSGSIGGAAAALAAAVNGRDAMNAEAFHSTLRRWTWPQPRVSLGSALCALDFRISAMDVSDGLTASLQQLSRITGLGFTVEAAALPIEDDVVVISQTLGLDPVHLACSASVDFELLVGCRPENETELLGAARASGTTLTRIGTCVAGRTITMNHRDGGAYATLPGVPWDHQTTDMSGMFDARR